MTIIGNGTVGKAMGKAMKVTPLGKSDEVVSDDVVFICVPTPTIDGKQDISEVEQAIKRVKTAQLIVIRSTILPHTTDILQINNPIPIMFLPEFGKEKTMEYDMAHPECYIFGMTKQSMPVGGLALEYLPEAPMIRVNAIAAEFAKYFSNIWKASQVILTNSLYDWVIKESESDVIYQQVIGAISKLSDIPKYGWKINDEGRGYSGKCLPKDVQAAVGQYPNKLWLEIEKYNKELNADK